MASRAARTHTTYSIALGAYVKFCKVYGYDPQLPPNVEWVAQFISYLSFMGYAGSTIQTYISGLAFYMSSSGLQDVTKSFVITRLIEGCRRSTLRRDARHPITLSVLNRMLAYLRHVCGSHYDVLMYSAAFSVAFYGLLRVSELTVESRHRCESILQHTFRIGAATTAAMAGCSDEEIQRMGRWVSSAHRRYI
ncbi:uncharacterized protein LOC121416747, partial [Lytechinus variegatus]|uniref:uncharacterized protein LOC121416747 n=1 Tax=Lytechinus variegatus TaxID=7654 RepID=UPI001BB195F3